MIQFQAWGSIIKIWPSEIIGFVLFFGVIILFWRAHTDPKNPIDLAHMFVWPGTHQTSAAIVLAFCGGVVAMWVVIDQELKGKLEAEVFIGFLATVVAGKVATESVNAWRAKSQPGHDRDDDCPPPMPDHVGDEGAADRAHQRRLEGEVAELKQAAS